MANFIPPEDGLSQGNYFLANFPKMAVFEAKTGLQKLRWHPKLQRGGGLIALRTAYALRTALSSPFRV